MRLAVIVFLAGLAATAAGAESSSLQKDIDTCMAKSAPRAQEECTAAAVQRCVTANASSRAKGESAQAFNARKAAAREKCQQEGTKELAAVRSAAYTGPRPSPGKPGALPPGMSLGPAGGKASSGLPPGMSVAPPAGSDPTRPPAGMVLDPPANRPGQLPPGMSLGPASGAAGKAGADAGPAKAP
jgi:hypothetical protein